MKKFASIAIAACMMLSLLVPTYAAEINANGGSGNDNALNSYAMAGYIAGNLFVQALKSLEEKGLELNWADFNDVMESTEFKLPMGGTINFANGDRLAITSLALNTISLEIGESGYYELQVVSPIMSLDDVLASIA